MNAIAETGESHPSASGVGPGPGKPSTRDAILSEWRSHICTLRAELRKKRNCNAAPLSHLLMIVRVIRDFAADTHSLREDGLFSPGCAVKIYSDEIAETVTVDVHDHVGVLSLPRASSTRKRIACTLRRLVANAKELASSDSVHSCVIFVAGEKHRLVHEGSSRRRTSREVEVGLRRRGAGLVICGNGSRLVASAAEVACEAFEREGVR